ncbi:hypothetical protein NDU88_011376 [Pleurodeles waltl]|uniref:Uncharacterized protein n=1 Tax=Pleurodeles waltl TaxID=8319 RepID=A0AAV7R1H0_PLEWA|nr:hypothetical protein NDU88_011376 [Pleurodeles waltl]
MTLRPAAALRLRGRRQQEPWGALEGGRVKRPSGAQGSDRKETCERDLGETGAMRGENRGGGKIKEEKRKECEKREHKGFDKRARGSEKKNGGAQNRREEGRGRSKRGRPGKREISHKACG